jgi:hypothetical protein
MRTGILYEGSEGEDLEDFQQLNENNFEELDRFPEVDDFVLIRFHINKSKKSVYYVEKILELKNDDQDFQVSFLRKSDKMAGKSFFFLP